MEEITIFTKAYNPGKLIYRCIDSVLNQTFKDFVFVIIDNASKDGTKEVLEDYARKDSRIKLYRNEENNIAALQILERYIDTPYFIMIDHDDWLEPDAMERLYHALQENRADMVFARTTMWNTEGTAIDTWGINKKLVMGRNDIPKYFPEMYWQMRTFWNILIRKEMIQYLNKEMILDIRKGLYAIDTTMTFNMVFSAERLVFLPEITHNYLLHGNSENHNFRRNQFYSNWRILDIAYDYLQSLEPVSQRNLLFLYKVYVTSVCDTLENDLKANPEPEILREIVEEILTDPHTEKLVQMLSCFEEEKKRFWNLFGHCVFSLYLEGMSRKQGELFGGIPKKWLNLMYAGVSFSEKDIESLCGQEIYFLQFLCRNELQRFFAELVAQKKELSFSSGLLGELLLILKTTPKEFSNIALVLLKEHSEIKERIMPVIWKLAAQNRILEKCEEGFLNENAETVLLVCSEQYGAAMDVLISKAEEGEEVAKELPELLANLAAIVGDVEVFLAAKKLQFTENYNCGEYEKAKTILLDLKEMCPNDEDVVSWEGLFITEE